MIFGGAEILASLEIPAEKAKLMLVPTVPENKDDLIFAGFTDDYYFREKVVFK